MGRHFSFKTSYLLWKVEFFCLFCFCFYFRILFTSSSTCELELHCHPRLRKQSFLHCCAVMEVQTAKWLQGKSEIDVIPPLYLCGVPGISLLVCWVSLLIAHQAPQTIPIYSLFWFFIFESQLVSNSSYTVKQNNQTLTSVKALVFPRQRSKVSCHTFILKT